MSKKEIKKTKVQIFDIAEKQRDFLFDQFQKESDRAAVILVVSIIDENLTTILKSYLVPNPSSSDSLFDNAMSPLSNFSSKIDMCYRLGLISGKFARDLHIVRKIRNSFAHDIYGCSFDNGSVISRIRELENSFHNGWINLMEDIERDDELLSGIRGKFIFFCGNMIKTLTDLVVDLEEFEESEIEWFYCKPEAEKKEK